MAAQAARLSMKKKRQAALEQKHHEAENSLKEKFEDWVTKSDKEQDSTIGKTELQSLLTELHPDRPPSDEHIDLLMKHLGTGATAKQLHHVVNRYEAYASLGPKMDDAFDRFDKDGSGKLEKEVNAPPTHPLRPWGVCGLASA